MSETTRTPRINTNALAFVLRWCSETEARADAMAPEDDWGDTIGDTLAADVMRRCAAEVRALIEGPQR